MKVKNGMQIDTLLLQKKLDKTICQYTVEGIKTSKLQVDYVNNIWNNIKKNTREGDYPLTVHKKNWLHTNLFSKHSDKLIGFVFYWPWPCT